MGELAPPRMACSRAGGGCGRGSPPPAEEVRGCYPPEKFFSRFLMPNPAFGGNLGQKTN